MKELIYHLTRDKIDRGWPLLWRGPNYSDKKQELSQYSQKINVILTKLRRQITLCRQQIGQLSWLFSFARLQLNFLIN
jgi:hypothetical protein